MAYTLRRIFLAVPAMGIAGLAVLDECLQIFSAGRGAQIVDILVDALGGICGLAFALLTVWLVWKIIKRGKHETRESGNSVD